MSFEINGDFGKILLARPGFGGKSAPITAGRRHRRRRRRRRTAHGRPKVNGATGITTARLRTKGRGFPVRLAARGRRCRRCSRCRRGPSPGTDFPLAPTALRCNRRSRPSRACPLSPSGDSGRPILATASTSGRPSGADSPRAARGGRRDDGLTGRREIVPPFPEGPRRRLSSSCRLVVVSGNGSRASIKCEMSGLSARRGFRIRVLGVVAGYVIHET